MPSSPLNVVAVTLLLGGALAACDGGRSPAQPAAVAAGSTSPAPTPAAPVASSVPAPAAAPTPPASSDPMAQTIEAAKPAPGAAVAAPPADQTAQAVPPADAPPDPLLIKVEVLLGRAHFSPGVIDGRPGTNLTRALAAFEAARGLPGAGALTPEAFDALTKVGGGPITQAYVTTAQDAAGPYLGTVPKTFPAMAKLPRMDYASPAQALSERFHMSQGLLKALNPGADLARAGTTLLVANPGDDALPGPVARIEVDKTNNQVRAFDDGGRIEAVFPATVGSTDRPAPSGRFAVIKATQNPDYVYDPSRLTFGPRSKGKLTIKPGPNNPVGTTWISLTKPTYGIHGAPDPTTIGKTASHGCVRLTNWDAATLGAAVSKGVPVDFVGQTSKA